MSAVQRAVHVSVTGHYGSATVAAVTNFQDRHAGVPRTGGMNTATWRALLAAVR